MNLGTPDTAGERERLGPDYAYRLCADYNGSNLDLNSYKLETFPENTPSIVDGDFYCGYNSLKSLHNSPRYIAGSFCCNGCIGSLDGAPDLIGGTFL